MKRLFFFIYLLVAGVSIVFAQEQHGYVKTKGRLSSDGQVIAGVRLPGVTVRLNDKNVVSKDSTGTFSFVVSNNRFTVLDIQKKDYELYDLEQLRDYTYSSNPLILVLEKKEDRESDKLMAQQKINRTLRRQLQQREDELERLREENKITQQEYQRLYNELYSYEKKNQELIESMAEKYSSMDFDQMDDESRKIKTLILNGELQKADSIINAKGNIEDRIAAYHAIKEANRQEETELAEREKQLQRSKTGEKLTLMEIAEDCMNKHEMYKLRFMFDSAAYYIQLRADLDTMNYKWQFETAFYYQKQNSFASSEKHYLRSINILKFLVQSNPQAYEPDLAQSYNNLAELYSNTQRFSESEAMYKKAIEIYERLVQSNPQTYEPDLATSYNNLAALYSNTQRFSESEAMHKEALAIRERLAQSNPQAYEPGLAMSYNNLALLYSNTQRLSESEAMHKEALAIRERLAQSNPQAYEPNLAQSYNNLALLYSNTQRFSESEAMHKEALAIRERLAQYNPQAYEPDLAMSYSNLASLYYYATQRFSESEAMYKQAIAIFERLTQSNPQAYEPGLANIYNNLALLYSDTQRFSESEAMHKEAIAIRERLAQSNPQAYEPALAQSYNNFAELYRKTQRLLESEAMYKKALAIRERLAQSNSQAYEPSLADSYNNLALLYSDTQRFSESEAMHKEALAIRERLAQSNPQVYEPQLMGSYYWLGWTMLLEEKINEAQEPFKKSLNIARKQVKAGAETTLYWESLYCLSFISANKKDYASAYAYNEELLPLMNAMYQKYTEGWKANYLGQLVSQSFYANLLGKFKEGEHYSLEAIKVDSTQHIAYTNLAAALLFQGKVEEAENLYRQYKAEFKEGFLDDFAEYERLGVVPYKRKKDVEKIKSMLKEQ